MDVYYMIRLWDFLVIGKHHKSRVSKYRGVTMERLTLRNENGNAITKTLAFQYLIDKLAEYEDKEENGLIMEIPYPVGTPLYFAFKLQGVKKDRIRRWQLNHKGLWFSSYGNIYRVDAIGKSVFLSEKEAEEKLKEWYGKESVSFK